MEKLQILNEKKIYNLELKAELLKLKPKVTKILILTVDSENRDIFSLKPWFKVIEEDYVGIVTGKNLSNVDTIKKFKHYQIYK